MSRRTPLPARRSALAVQRFAARVLVVGAAALVGLAGCADDSVADGAAGDEHGFGVLALALGAAVPGATHMRVDVYEGAPTSPTSAPSYALACGSYFGGDGAPLNPFMLDKLPARKDYAVVVRLFADAACSAPVLVAYRGGIVVAAGSDGTDAPYYLQPARYGAFTGMALPSEAIRTEVAKRSCTSDAECASAHAAAVCVDNRCALESLFPLNGGAKRGLPVVTTLGDGRVAIHGGASVQDATGLWAATSQRVEVFDPRLGRFEMPAAQVAGFEDAARVALGFAVSGEATAFLSAGGSARIRLAREGVKVRTGLDDATCGAAADCPVRADIYRVELASKTATKAQLPLIRALPILARVATPAGSRLLVAGGASVPLPKSGDPRSGDAQLCALDGKATGCTASAALLQAGRAGAATLCLDTTELSPAGCKRLLIFGGRASKASPLAELYNAGQDTFEPVALGPGLTPEQVHGGQLLRLDDTHALLIGATAAPLFLDPAGSVTPAALAPLVVTIDESTSPLRLTLAEAKLGAFAGSDGGKRTLPAALLLPASAGRAAAVVVAGGIDAAGKILGDALLFDVNGEATGRIALERPRYGARLAETGGGGPLGGCAMLVGGFGAGTSGKDEALAHVEVFCRTPE